MTASVRSYLTTGLALMGVGFVTAAQITPPLHQAETRVVEAAVSLAAAVGNGLPCSGYNTDGCDINAPQTYTPVVLDPSGSAANIAANIVNAVASIPRAFVDAVNGLSYALEVTGNWWVYSPTNVLGSDPADPPKYTALVDLLIPFKPVSNVVGEHLSWWGKSNLPMDAGCTADVGPHCTDVDAILSKMFLVPIWTLATGYQFPKIFNPVSAEEGAIGNEIPGSVGDEVPWSEAYVKLNLLDPAYALINYLRADPSTNAPKPIASGEIAATLNRLANALKLDFNPFVPMSFLLKGWPYTALTPLFKPFVPLLCPTCNPVDPGLPPVTPAQSAAATLVSAEAPVDATEPAAPAITPVADADPAPQVGEPVQAKAVNAPVANAVAAVTAVPAEEPVEEEALESAPATGEDTAGLDSPAVAADLSSAADAAPAVTSEPVSKPRRGQQSGARTSTAAGADADQGGSVAKSRVRAAASAE
jgi:hypothetical protein